MSRPAKLRLARLGAGLCVAWTLACAGAPAAAQGREAALKAAFLLNFAQFTNWPENAFGAGHSSIVLCVFRDALPPEALEPLKQKSVGGRPLQIRTVEKAPDLSGCRMLFVDGAPPELVAAAIEFGRSNPCLTVSDVQNFSQLGGHIEIFEQDNRFRFRVNLPAARGSGLNLSSRLLQLAVIIE